MRWLLRLYPKAWRRRYGEEFAALLEEDRMTPAAVRDVIRGAFDARLRPQVTGGATMTQFSTRPPIIGFVLLALPSFFLLAVILKYGLGVPYLFDPLETYLYGPNLHTLRSMLADMLIVFSPVVALLVNLISALRIGLRIERGGLAGTVTMRSSFLSLGAMAVSLALIGVFTAYIISENVAEAAIRRYLGA